MAGVARPDHGTNERVSRAAARGNHVEFSMSAEKWLDLAVVFAASVAFGLLGWIALIVCSIRADEARLPRLLATARMQFAAQASGPLPIGAYWWGGPADRGRLRRRIAARAVACADGIGLPLPARGCRSLGGSSVADTPAALRLGSLGLLASHRPERNLTPQVGPAGPAFSLPTRRRSRLERAIGRWVLL